MPRRRPPPLSDEADFEVVVKNTFLEVSRGGTSRETSPSGLRQVRAAINGGLRTAPASLVGAMSSSLDEAASQSSSVGSSGEGSAECGSACAGKALPQTPTGASDGADTETTAPSTPSRESLCLWPPTPGTPGAPVQISLAELMTAESCLCTLAAANMHSMLAMPGSMYQPCWDWEWPEWEYPGGLGPPPPPPPPPLGSPKLPPHVQSLEAAMQLESAPASQVFNYVMSAPVPKCTPPCAPPRVLEAAEADVHSPPIFDALAVAEPPAPGM